MRRRGETIIHLTVVTLLLLILAATTLPETDFLPGASDQMLIEQTKILDRSLATWARHHSGRYPAQLSYLQEVEILPDTFSLTKFSYSPTAPKYILTVTLSKGTIYKSPGSN